MQPLPQSPATTTDAPRPLPWIAAIHPYVPGRSAAADGRKLVKLSANENPYGPGPAARAALAGAGGDPARYPDPDSRLLREAIAAAHDLLPERVICGTGSDELLNLAAQAFAGPGDAVHFVRYGFSVYEIAARRVGAEPVVAPDRDYGTDVDALLAGITPRSRVVFVANPNNPTGTLLPAGEIRRLHAGLPPHVLLVLDHAYAEYLQAEQDDGGLALAAAAPNVLVTRTFSKIHGLAAERIGWATGAPALIDALNRIRGPFNVTATGQRAAAAAIADRDHVVISRERNRAERDRFAAVIAGLANHGLRMVPGAANFALVLFEGTVTAEAAYRALEAEGYLVRWLPHQGLGHALRITFGTEAEMKGLAAALRAAVGERG